MFGPDGLLVGDTGKQFYHLAEVSASNAGHRNSLHKEFALIPIVEPLIRLKNILLPVKMAKFLVIQEIIWLHQWILHRFTEILILRAEVDI